MPVFIDRKSTRLNSSHVEISYAVFCLKKKKNHREPPRQHLRHSQLQRQISLVPSRSRCSLLRLVSRVFFSSPPLIAFALRIFFFLNDPATTEIYTLSLHDALPICRRSPAAARRPSPAPQPPASSRGWRRPGCRCS